MGVSSALIGVIYVLLILGSLPLHLLMIWIILRTKEFRKLPAYGIMVNMSICECTLMVGHFMGGLMSVCQTIFHDSFAKVGGAFVGASWIGIVIFMLLLSLNRFLVFACFHMTKHSERRFFICMAIMSWLVPIVSFVLHFVPALSLTYDVTLGMYAFKGELSASFEYTDNMIILVTQVMTFMLCMATVAAAILMRNMNPVAFKLHMGEVKMFIQSTVIFSYLTMIRFAWLFAPYGEVVTIALGLATQAVGLLNPVLYLIFNTSIRNQFLTAFRTQNNVSIVRVSNQNLKNQGSS
uniref:G_PROTEIN_RECEP_F1_2 domain-containing protein n=1 Tax=Steinernema glaseri TaxID=37863 RepID=A0A1I7XZW6_9BILA